MAKSVGENKVVIPETSIEISDEALKAVTGGKNIHDEHVWSPLNGGKSGSASESGSADLNVPNRLPGF